MEDKPEVLELAAASLAPVDERGRENVFDETANERVNVVGCSIAVHDRNTVRTQDVVFVFSLAD